MLRFTLLSLAFFFSLLSYAQTRVDKRQTRQQQKLTMRTWEDFVSHITDNEELTEDEEWMERMEELEELTLHPLNINVATKDELMQIPILDEIQATEIRDYIELHNGMKTLYELVLIETIPYTTRSFLPLFLCVGEGDIKKQKELTCKEMIADSHHEILSRIDIPLYYREGFMRKDGYHGSPLYNKTRYTFTASQHIEAGLRFERDAGERGIDSYGGQISLHNIKHLNKLIVGDYRVAFGEGLVANQGISFGKNTLQKISSNGIRPHKGTDETNFMRGVAATFKWGGISLTSFASHRLLDATLQGDSCIKTLQKSGLHRTTSERNNKENVQALTGGLHIGWKNRRWSVGATGYFMHTSLPLTRGNELYRQIAPQGDRLTALGIDYAYKGYRWSLHGETAVSPTQGGMATLNTLNWRATNRYSLTLSQRYYNRFYYSHFARAVCDNTNVQNETAVSLRLDATPIDGLHITAFGDFFLNPWPRYGLTHGSKGQDGRLEIQYDMNRNQHLFIRYNVKSKEVSQGQRVNHRVMCQWTAQHAQWTFRTTGTLHALRGSCGEALGEMVQYTATQPWKAALAACYFYTQDYDSRIFLYEPSVSQAFSMQSFFGHGLRLAASLQYNLWKQRLRFEIKYGYTQYLDGRKTQATGLQTIYSNCKNDIIVQLKLKI